MRRPSLILAVVLAAASLRAPRTIDAQTRDTTYFEFQVTKPVTPLKGSAHPKYPDVLKTAGVTGETLVQFVVDTLGVADIASFKVLRTTHELFAASVKAALPLMAYSPAEINGRKVRQLVQQPFVFGIEGADGKPGGATPSTAPLVRMRAAPLVDASDGGLTPAPRTGSVNGWRIEARTSIDSGGGRPATTFTMTTSGTDGVARLEVSNAALATRGMYSLFDTAAHRVRVVMPQQQMVSITALGVAADDGPRTLENSVRDRVVKDLGAGGTIAGVPTHHYRVSGVTVTKVAFDGRVCTTETPQTTEYWMSTDLALAAASTAMRRTMSAVNRAPILPAVAEEHLFAPPGVAVRSVATLATGASAGTTATYEITAFSSGPIDAAQFDPPAGYHVLDTTPFAARMNVDSMRRSASRAVFARLIDSTALAPGQKRRCTPAAPR